MLTVQGADQLIRLSKALKDAGDKELRQELSKGISQAMKPVMKEVRQSALSTLPDRGGLAQRVSKSSMRTSRTTGAHTAGVRLRAKSSYHLGNLDRGINKHPLFGNREVWITQRVQPGWWSRPTDAAKPKIYRELLTVMQRVARRLERAA